MNRDKTTTELKTAIAEKGFELHTRRGLGSLEGFASKCSGDKRIMTESFTIDDNKYEDAERELCRRVLNAVVNYEKTGCVVEL